MAEALTAAQIAAHKAALEARLAELAALAQATSEDAKPVELDQQAVGRLSRMDALQQQAMAAATRQRRQAEARAVRAALARIDEGEFGYCAACGEAIAPARLALDPTIPSCIKCAGA